MLVLTLHWLICPLIPLYFTRPMLYLQEVLDYASKWTGLFRLYIYNHYSFLQIFWRCPYFAFETSEGWLVGAKLHLVCSVMGSDWLSTFSFLKALSWLLHWAPFVRFLSYSPYLVSPVKPPQTWATLPSSLCLWSLSLVTSPHWPQVQGQHPCSQDFIV